LASPSLIQFILDHSLDGSVVCTNHEDNARTVDEFYTNLLGSTQDREHSLDLHAIGVPSHNLDDLDAPFTEKEVWETIKQVPFDKVPGLDGLTGCFYKSCWTTIKQDIMMAISAIWSRKFGNF
jgi:hypothetical protein